MRCWFDPGELREPSIIGASDSRSSRVGVSLQKAYDQRFYERRPALWSRRNGSALLLPAAISCKSEPLLRSSSRGEDTVLVHLQSEADARPMRGRRWTGCAREPCRSRARCALRTCTGSSRASRKVRCRRSALRWRIALKCCSSNAPTTWDFSIRGAQAACNPASRARRRSPRRSGNTACVEKGKCSVSSTWASTSTAAGFNRLHSPSARCDRTVHDGRSNSQSGSPTYPTRRPGLCAGSHRTLELGRLTQARRHDAAGLAVRRRRSCCRRYGRTRARCRRVRRAP